MDYLNYIVVFVLTLTINTSSSTTDDLNDRIYKCQKRSISNFDSSIEVQYKFRKDFVNKIKELKVEKSNDTIILAESFHVGCGGCPAGFVEVFTADRYLTFELNILSNKFRGYKHNPEIPVNNYKTYRDYSKGEYLHKDLEIIMQSLREGKSLSEIVKENNTTDCLDGSQTIYTIIYPNGDLGCMKIRCWKYLFE